MDKLKRILFVVTCVYASTRADQEFMSADACSPLVIAHRGASGYVPEHTLGSYALAITMGADYIEPDLIMTKDGHLIARHENVLQLSTDVASRPEFASRRRTAVIDGFHAMGWFTEDFTLAEIKTLRAIEPIPDRRPGSARMDGHFEIATFEEIIELVKSMETIQCRRIGIYPEIKLSTYFKELNLPMEQLVADTFHKHGYRGPEAPAYIQSFEISNLRELKKMTDLRLIQLLSSSIAQPTDQVKLGTNVTYKSMATAQGLKEIATYAYSVGPDKSFIIPRNETNNLGTPTEFVAWAHEAGLKVHPYTFRAENVYLPAEYRSDDASPDAVGDLAGEMRAFLAAGIDGFFTDQPDVLVRLREPCVSTITQCRPTATTGAAESAAPVFWLYSILVIALYFNLK